MKLTKSLNLISPKLTHLVMVKCSLSMLSRVKGGGADLQLRMRGGQLTDPAYSNQPG